MRARNDTRANPRLKSVVEGTGLFTAKAGQIRVLAARGDGLGCYRPLLLS